MEVRVGAEARSGAPVRTGGFRPLGYWLRHLHELLETYFRQELKDEGADRRQWQLLHTLSRGPRTVDELATALSPFWTADEPDPRPVLAELAARGWTVEAGGAVQLTPAGRAAHAALTARVARVRSTVTEGLTGEQYEQTIRVLSQMAGNLEAALAARGAGTDPAG